MLLESNRSADFATVTQLLHSLAEESPYNPDLFHGKTYDDAKTALNSVKHWATADLLNLSSDMFNLPADMQETLVTLSEAITACTTPLSSTRFTNPSHCINALSFLRQSLETLLSPLMANKDELAKNLIERSSFPINAIFHPIGIIFPIAEQLNRVALEIKHVNKGGGADGAALSHLADEVCLHMKTATACFSFVGSRGYNGYKGLSTERQAELIIAKLAHLKPERLVKLQTCYCRLSVEKDVGSGALTNCVSNSTHTSSTVSPPMPAHALHIAAAAGSASPSPIATPSFSSTNTNCSTSHPERLEVLPTYSPTLSIESCLEYIHLNGTIQRCATQFLPEQQHLEVLPQNFSLWMEALLAGVLHLSDHVQVREGKEDVLVTERDPSPTDVTHKSMPEIWGYSHSWAYALLVLTALSNDTRQSSWLAMQAGWQRLTSIDLNGLIEDKLIKNLNEMSVNKRVNGVESGEKDGAESSNSKENGCTDTRLPPKHRRNHYLATLIAIVSPLKVLKVRYEAWLARSVAPEEALRSAAHAVVQVADWLVEYIHSFDPNHDRFMLHIQGAGALFESMTAFHPSVTPAVSWHIEDRPLQVAAMKSLSTLALVDTKHLDETAPKLMEAVQLGKSLVQALYSMAAMWGVKKEGRALLKTAHVWSNEANMENEFEAIDRAIKVGIRYTLHGASNSSTHQAAVQTADLTVQLACAQTLMAGLKFLDIALAQDFPNTNDWYTRRNGTILSLLYWLKLAYESPVPAHAKILTSYLGKRLTSDYSEYYHAASLLKNILLPGELSMLNGLLEMGTGEEGKRAFRVIRLKGRVNWVQLLKYVDVEATSVSLERHIERAKLLGTRPCAYLRCTKVIESGNTSVKRCGGCNVVSYCSRACQSKDWGGSGGAQWGHKHACQALRGSGGTRNDVGE